MTLEQRGERLVITSLPIQDMALLSLGIPLDEPARQVLGALLRGERVAVLAEAMEYRQYLPEIRGHGAPDEGDGHRCY